MCKACCAPSLGGGGAWQRGRCGGFFRGHVGVVGVVVVVVGVDELRGRCCGVTWGGGFVVVVLVVLVDVAVANGRRD